MIIFGLIAVFAEAVAIYIYGGFIVGHFQHAHFILPSDLSAFRSNAAAMLGLRPLLTAREAGVTPYMYPPPFLFLAAPLAWLGAFWAYALWSAAGVGLFALAGRAAKLPWPAIALGLAAPPSLYCLAIGQVAMFVSSLLLFSLSLLNTSPILAGVAAGCLIVKPQLAILLPICFVASRNWKAFIAAATTICVLCTGSFCVFGIPAWHQFLTSGVPLAHAMLVRPWPVGFQSIMVSPFMAVRSLGGSLSAASIVQCAATLAAAVASWYLWYPASRVEMPARIMLTLSLVLLASPYGYIYDMSGIAAALAAEAIKSRGRFMVAAAMLWLVTALYIIISGISFVMGGFLLAIMVVYLWPKSLHPLAHAGANDVTTVANVV